MKNRRFIPTILYLLLLISVFSWASELFGGENDQLPYSQVVDLFRSEQVKAFEIQDETITMELYTPIDGETIVRATLAYPESFLAEMSELLEEQRASGVLEYYRVSPKEPFSPYDLILPLVMAGLVLLFAWAMLMSRANNNNPRQNFGKARTVQGVPDGKKVTFADVAGADEEKKNCRKWWISCEILRNSPISAPGFPTVCCWLALPVPVRPYWPVR